MKAFKCGQCGQQVFFENRVCESCGAALGFDPRTRDMVALAAAGSFWSIVEREQDGLYQWCANYDSGGCNWLVAQGEEAFCKCCRHNQTIPDLSLPGNTERWRGFEAAKRWLFYALLTLNLPLRTRAEDPIGGLAFDCIDDVQTPNGDQQRAMTGHDNGVITIALAETDSAKREKARANLGETYRTLLGHMRHEIGHYYWDVLVRDRPQFLARCRALFGDEREDYAQALQNYYANGPKPNWNADDVTPYASSHPWEDFAETWQHYLHIIDTLETARAFDVAVAPLSKDAAAPRPPFDPYHSPDIERLIDAWAPLTIAVNNLNRSMGQPDLYPFVLPAAAIQKLDFIRDLIARADEPPELETDQSTPEKPSLTARLQRFLHPKPAAPEQHAHGR